MRFLTQLCRTGLKKATITFAAPKFYIFATRQLTFKTLDVMLSPDWRLVRYTFLLCYESSTPAKDANLSAAVQWLTTFSGLLIMFVMPAFNLMGDTPRDLLNPRLHGE